MTHLQRTLRHRYRRRTLSHSHWAIHQFVSRLICANQTTALICSDLVECSRGLLACQLSRWARPRQNPRQVLRSPQSPAAEPHEGGDDRRAARAQAPSVVNKWLSRSPSTLTLTSTWVGTGNSGTRGRTTQVRSAKVALSPPLSSNQRPLAVD